MIAIHFDSPLDHLMTVNRKGQGLDERHGMWGTLGNLQSALIWRIAMLIQRLFLLIWFLCLTGPLTRAQADILWGVNGHPFTAYPGIDFEQQLDYLKDLGMKSYRVNISNAASAPALGKLIAAAKSRDIEVLPVITPGDISLENDSTDVLYRKAFDLASTLVAKFKTDVRVWELGNEMENYAIIKACEMRDDGTQYDCAWGPAGGVHTLDYYGPRWAKVSAVLKGLSDGTISVDPTIRKAMGTAGWGHLGAFSRMQQDGIQWDISVWHMYGEDPETAFQRLATFGNPIWVTEFNNPGGSQPGKQEQADGLKRAMTRLQQLQDYYDIEAAHIYELLDEPYWGEGFEAVMGLVPLTKDGKDRWTPARPKPAYQVVKKFIRGSDAAPTPQRDCHLGLSRRVGSLPFEQYVSYSYCLVLGRQVDVGSLQSWTKSLRAGRTVDEMLMDLLGSDEFRSRYATFGLSNPGYVALLYRVLLDREPDGGGLSSYVAQLEKGSVSFASIAEGILDSEEFQSRHPALFSGAGR
jgi:hypothetical protein